MTTVQILGISWNIHRRDVIDNGKIVGHSVELYREDSIQELYELETPQQALETHNTIRDTLRHIQRTYGADKP